MDVNSFVTIIPNDPVALEQVTTPFVSFVHPLTDRIGRFERQIESMARYNVGILLGDTWPDSYHDRINWVRTHQTLDKYTEPQTRWATVLWPETALYVTGVAKMLGVNASIRYRPQLWTFCQFFEKCRNNSEDIDLLNEGTIYSSDRSVYPLSYPQLSLQEEQYSLSIFWYGATEFNRDGLKLPHDIEILSAGDVTPDGENFNRLVEKAHGRYIAVCRDGDTIVPSRFNLQMDAKADLCISPVVAGGSPWLLRGYTQVADTPSEQLSTMMIRRDVFNRVGGAATELTAGFDYDLFVRICADSRNSVAYISEPLVARELSLPCGSVYTQQVYNDAANRVRYTKDYHAIAVRERPLA